LHENPRHPQKHWHYLYLAFLSIGLSNAGIENIGRHDWFREGSEYLLKKQKEDGSWNDQNCPGPIDNTCFALLFLANPP
jgi:hypothetical protein